MFEVVMGIPKSEGMRPPPKIPANPSFVELDEDENAVEKFKKAMDNISSILSLDRLKQVNSELSHTHTHTHTHTCIHVHPPLLQT